MMARGGLGVVDGKAKDILASGEGSGVHVEGSEVGASKGERGVSCAVGYRIHDGGAGCAGEGGEQREVLEGLVAELKLEGNEWQGAAGSERMHEADRGPGAGEGKYGVAEEDGGVSGGVGEQ